MTTNNTTNRRDFIRSLLSASAVGALGSVGQLTLMREAVAAAPEFDDYKALVCIFLYGGNDSFNMILPSGAGTVADNPKGSIVKGTVKEVDQKAAVVDLGEGVEGVLRASEIARDRVEDVRQHLKEGEVVEAKFIGTDRKSRMLSLSIKAKDYAEEAEAMQDYNDTSGESSGGTTLGDLMKEQLGDLDK